MRELTYQLRWAIPVWCVGVLTNWLPENRVTLRLRGALARPFIGRCGRNFQLGALVTLRDTHRLSVGNDVYIARGSWLDASGTLSLEDEVVLGPYVVISTTQHVFRNGSVRFGGGIARPVTVRRGSWVGAHVSVKCGVTIGQGNLIAANAFVARDTPDGVIVGGVPAEIIRANADRAAEFFTRQDLERRHEEGARAGEDDDRSGAIE
jgi:acetyltransferase-like isoleucine patch superfamily enzyme